MRNTKRQWPPEDWLGAKSCSEGLMVSINNSGFWKTFTSFGALSG